jgi:hypothetical protein
VLLGGAGATNVVTDADLSTSTNLTTMASGLFVGASTGNYQLASGGPGSGKGVASFGGQSAPANSSGGHDIGAFDFVH